MHSYQISRLDVSRGYAILSPSIEKGITMRRRNALEAYYMVKQASKLKKIRNPFKGVKPSKLDPAHKARLEKELAKQLKDGAPGVDRINIGLYD